MAKDDRGKDNRPEKEAAKPLPTGSGPAKPADAALKAAGTATPKPVIDLQAREITRPDASRTEPSKAEPAQAEPAKTEPGVPLGLEPSRSRRAKG